jgi:hypothetical protein
MLEQKKNKIDQIINITHPVPSSVEQQKELLAFLLEVINTLELHDYAIKQAKDCAFLASTLNQYIPELPTALIPDVLKLSDALIAEMNKAELDTDECREEMLGLASYCADNVTKDQLNIYFDYCEELFTQNGVEKENYFANHFLDTVFLNYPDEVKARFSEYDDATQEDDEDEDEEEEAIRPAIFNSENLQLIADCVAQNNYQDAMTITESIFNTCDPRAPLFNENNLDLTCIHQLYILVHWAFSKNGPIKSITSKPFLLPFVEALKRLNEQLISDDREEKIKFLTSLLPPKIVVNAPKIESYLDPALALAQMQGNVSDADGHLSKKLKVQGSLAVPLWSNQGMRPRSPAPLSSEQQKINAFLATLSSKDNLIKRDSFFESIAQVLNLIQKPKGGEYNVFALRMTCFFYINNGEKNSQWVKKAVEKKGINFTDYTGSLPLSSNDVQNNEKLFGMAWGSPEVEGRILCEELNISLHIMQASPSDNSTKFVNTLVNAQGSRLIDSALIDYSDPNIVHLTMYADCYCAMPYESQVHQIRQKLQ